MPTAQSITASPEAPVLVVDDEEAELRLVARTLQAGGIDNVLCIKDSRQVMDALASREVGAVMLDLAMPHLSGEELLAALLEQHPEVPVIIFSGFNEVEVAVRCIRAGALDYMVKPVEASRMTSGVKRALELAELRRENVLLRRQLIARDVACPEAFADFASTNRTMKAIFKYVETVSRTAKPVLITGETGTGKELIAQAIHTLSGRQGQFVTVNVAGLDDNVFADTLFGHTKGAFTDARDTRKGLIERAAGGTLFLDEIGDMSTASQVKLLRLLQEGEYFPLGSDLPRRSDARVVVATNRDLDGALASGRFRRDLYYRLQTHHVDLPPLRDRLDDLPTLVDRFLEMASTALGKRKPTPPKELFDLLGTYHFPGNVRELESLVFDAVSLHSSRVLSVEVFRAHIRKHSQGRTAPPAMHEAMVFPQKLPTLKEVRNLQTSEAMRRANGNQAIAAELLGITRTALNKWLKRNPQ
jgi:DNA-binding NtrC family response regulator